MTERDTVPELPPQARSEWRTPANGALPLPEATAPVDDHALSGEPERPLSLRPRVAEPEPEPLPDQGSAAYVKAWDAVAPVAGHGTKVRHSRLLFARELVETAILAVAIFLAVRAVVQNFRVEGQSMDPTYATGQYVLVNKLLYQKLDFGPFGGERRLFHAPRRGEVIVFHPPLPELPNQGGERDFIKRVIGIPGDHVVIKDGKITVNGQELQEPYLKNAVQTFCGGQYCDAQLQQNQYFVMGDNRTNSSDSRLWGPVSGEKIIGKAWFVYLPFDDFGPAPNGTPILSPTRATARP